MSKVLYFNFDGTDNEPADAIQDKRLNGAVEDSSITNVMKFHLLLGGNLKEKTGHTLLEDGSRTFYYHGVGTYGNFFERKFNSGLAAEWADVRTILNLAEKDFEKHYIDGDGAAYIVVTGFSRGAALARRFASVINDRVNGEIIIEAVFDTVASIGMPNMSREERPSTEVVFEHGQTLPPNVKKALHLLSLDDKRKAFQPTLMNQDGRVTEIWFPGAHSDIGGGYAFDGLSDNALRFFLDWLEDQEELDIDFKSSKNIDYGNIFPQGSKLKIGADDVQVDENPFGINHEQHRTTIIGKMTLEDRVCCLIEKDRIVEDDLPMVHWSAAHRISGSMQYRPKSLKNTKHRLCYPDMVVDEKTFEGISDHKLVYKSRLKKPGKQGITTRVYAHRKYNHTGILLEKGKSYRFEVIGLPQHTWKDGSIKELDGTGWKRDDVALGFKEIVIAGMEPIRRVTARGAQWFTLCGCIGEDDGSAFVIGNLLEGHKPKKSGELCAFANDLNGYYGNNKGYLKIIVTAV